MLSDIELFDFCCYKHVKVRLGGAGLVLVTGKNQDSEGADSNGSGKSTLFKGLGWVLFGDSVDGERGVGVIRAGAKVAEGRLSFADGHRIVRKRTKSGPGLNVFGPDGEPVEAESLQLYIDNLFGMDWTRFRNTVLFGQRDTKRFLSPDTTDAERKDLFHRIVGTQAFKLAHERVKLRALELKRECDALDEQVLRLGNQIEGSGLEEAEAESAGWDKAHRIELARLKKEAKAKLDEIDSLKEPPGLKAAEDELSALARSRRDLPKLRESRDARGKEAEKAKLTWEIRRRERDDAKKDLHWKDEQLSMLEGELCPTCSSPLSGDRAEYVRTLRAQRDVLDDRYTNLSRSAKLAYVEMDAASLAFSTAKSAVLDAENAAERDSGRMAELRSEIDRMKAAAASADKRAHAKTLLAAARAKAAEVNPHTKRIEKILKDLAKWKAEQSTANEQRALKRAERQHVLFWVKGFSPEGLPSWALDSVMPFITDRANHYLQTLADGDISVMFKTQSELKSARGEIRDRISVDWTIETHTNVPPSGGQWRKMEIATDLAFMDLAAEYGSKPDILLMDEALDGLDSEGQSRVIDLLRELRTRRSSVFVVSHDEAVAEAFEKVIRFVKKGGVSGIEELAA